MCFKKLYFFFLLVGHLPLLPAQDALPVFPSTFTTTDGKTYQKVKLLKIDTDAVTIMNSDGGGLIPLKVLPRDLQTLCHYDPDKAEAAADKRKADDLLAYVNRESIRQGAKYNGVKAEILASLLEARKEKIKKQSRILKGQVADSLTGGVLVNVEDPAAQVAPSVTVPSATPQATTPAPQTVKTADSQTAVSPDPKIASLPVTQALTATMPQSAAPLDIRVTPAAETKKVPGDTLPDPRLLPPGQYFLSTRELLKKNAAVELTVYPAGTVPLDPLKPAGAQLNKWTADLDEAAKAP